MNFIDRDTARPQWHLAYQNSTLTAAWNDPDSKDDDDDDDGGGDDGGDGGDGDANDEIISEIIGHIRDLAFPWWSMITAQMCVVNDY